MISLGMLFLSDMLPNKDKYEIVGVLPKEISTPMPLVGFISTRAKDSEGAKALLKYLASSDAQAIFKSDGYEPHK